MTFHIHLIMIFVFYLHHPCSMQMKKHLIRKTVTTEFHVLIMKFMKMDGISSHRSNCSSVLQAKKFCSTNMSFVPQILQLEVIQRLLYTQ